MKSLLSIAKKPMQSGMFLNSSWGIVSNILQTLFVSLFFAIVARKYYPEEFAHFLIATTVYQLMAAFSTMGLSQWFIRAYINQEERSTLTSKFLKTQIGLGFIFYIFNIIFAICFYPQGEIRILCIILGTNIIFDNFINGLKSLNIAESKQKKTAAILAIDGLLKLLVSCLLFIMPLSLMSLSFLLIGVRILTLSLFIKLSSSSQLSLNLIFKTKLEKNDLMQMILKNWQFVVIGSISIIYWKVGNIIISKTMSLANVADYELSVRIFTIFQILPVVASATIFPKFITYVKQKDYAGLKTLYQTIFVAYTIFALISYLFIQTFAHLIIPVAFGNGYEGAIVCLQQMFLTFILLPTVLLQANLIVALGLEKLDMIYNILSLLVYIVACTIAFQYVKSLFVINYSILLSFIIFHLLQDFVLIKRKMTSIKHFLLFYILVLVVVYGYNFLSEILNPYIIFLASCMLTIVAVILFLIEENRKAVLVQKIKGN